MYEDSRWIIPLSIQRTNCLVDLEEVDIMLDI